MSEQHVSRTTVINEPLDATVTSAVSVPVGVVFVLDGTVQSLAAAATPVLFLEVQNPGSNAGVVFLQDAIEVEPGQSWYVDARFDLQEFQVQGVNGEEINLFYMELT